MKDKFKLIKSYIADNGSWMIEYKENNLEIKSIKITDKVNFPFMNINEKENENK